MTLRLIVGRKVWVIYSPSCLAQAKVNENLFTTCSMKGENNLLGLFSSLGHFKVS